MSEWRGIEKVDNPLFNERKWTIISQPNLQLEQQATSSPPFPHFSLVYQFQTTSPRITHSYPIPASRRCESSRLAHSQDIENPVFQRRNHISLPKPIERIINRPFIHLQLFDSFSMPPLPPYPRVVMRLRPGQEKRVFTTDEDALLTQLVSEFGDHAWTDISKRMPGRSCRQCRERWSLYLSPAVSNGPWATEEDSRLLDLYRAHGPRWTDIAKHYPTRTPNNIKNRFRQLERIARRLPLFTPPAWGTIMVAWPMPAGRAGILVPVYPVVEVVPPAVAK
jgi:hypothetical protein